MNALENYHNLIARTDDLCRTIAETLHEQLTCSEGCSACCAAISIFPVEAKAISVYLGTLPKETVEEIRRHAAENVAGKQCPLLKDHRCRGKIACLFKAAFAENAADALAAFAVARAGAVL